MAVFTKIEKLVSIIVPIYNASVYIERCVQSILIQSYRRIEIILVDDGSTDKSGEIVDRLAMLDNRIRVIHQQNKGVSCARNEGLKQALGEWISFVDVDDCLSDSYIEDLIPWEESVQMSICGLTRVFPDGSTSKWNLFRKSRCEEGKTLVCTIQEVMTDISSYALTGPVCKLFRNSIIQQNSLHFPDDMSFGEDSVFVFSYLFYVKAIHVVNKWLYNYYCTDDSLTCQANSEARLLVAHKVYNLSQKICKKNRIYNLDSVQYHYVDELMQVVASEDRPEKRYGCYEDIAHLLGTKTVKKCMPFYFPLFAKIGGWRFYECLNKMIYGNKW